MEENRSNKIPIIAGALFAVSAVLSFIPAFKPVRFAGARGVMLSIILSAGMLITAFSLIMKKNKLALVGLALPTLLNGYHSIGFLKTLFRKSGRGYLVFDFFFRFICFLLLLLMAVAVLKGMETIIEKYWLIPAAAACASFVLLIIIYAVSYRKEYYIDYYAYRNNWIGYLLEDKLTVVIGNLVMFSAIALTAFYFRYPEGREYHYDRNNAPAEYGYFSMAAHVLLLLFTGGIYLFIWIYRTTDYLNCIEDEEPRNPVTKLLLCMFVPFYFIYWIYKSAQRIDTLSDRRGIRSDCATTCLILGIFIPIVSYIIMQDKINTAAAAYVPVAETPPAPETNEMTDHEESRVKAELAAADNLMKYKELLDSGVITQEEFEKKKKQLLEM